MTILVGLLSVIEIKGIRIKALNWIFIPLLTAVELSYIFHAILMGFLSVTKSRELNWNFIPFLAAVEFPFHDITLSALLCVKVYRFTNKVSKQDLHYLALIPFRDMSLT